jgi:methyltransferase (TIGR00027 family)
MRENSPSSTASWVAAARGLGTLWPDDVRLADDPYGTAFADSRVTKLLARTRAARPIVMAPGFGTWVAYMQVRTRVFDDLARAIAAKPGAQVVLLGAGYDCRALRLPELARVPVFEVDHPATQQFKRDVLAKLHASSPSRYLTWNFEQQPMAELPGALAELGLDLAKPVLTIWEGVTMYLTDEAIDASLHAIRAWSAPGSRLAMLYAPRTVYAKPSLASRLVAAAVRRRGEPFRWGITPDALRPFLAERGFTVEIDRSIEDAARELLPARLAALVRHGSRYAVAS